MQPENPKEAEIHPSVNSQPPAPADGNLILIPFLGVFLLIGGVISVILALVNQPLVRGILIGVGVLTFSIQRIGAIQLIWGGFMIAAAGLSFMLHRRGMFLVIGSILILASLLNFFGGRITGWTALGLPQLVLGIIILTIYPEGAYSVSTQPGSPVPVQGGIPVPAGFQGPSAEAGQEMLLPENLARVFISYSRKDIAFARILNDTIHARGLESWIDWQDIPPSADWLAEVYAAIEAADTFVFVVSRTSVGSEICSKELAYAIQNNKRLIPIVIEDIPPAAVPKEIADLNWIFIRQGREDFQASFDTLLKTIRTNLEWVKSHTRLQIRALEWEKHAEDESYLLRGEDLQDANQQLARASAGWNPRPTDLQRKFLFSSMDLREREILERDAAHKRELKAQIRIRNIAIGFAIVLGFFLLEMWNGYNLVAISQVWLSQIGIMDMGKTGVWAVYSVDFSPDGKYLASGSADMHVRLWDVATGKMLGKPMPGHTSYVRGVKFSPDGTLLASASSDQTIRLWDVPSGLPHGQPLKAHTSSVEDVAFSPDGRLLASAGTDGRVQLWEVASGKALDPPLAVHDGLIFSLAFSPDGHWLVWGNDSGAISIWNMQAGRSFLSPIQACLAWDITFSPDGERFALGCDDGSIMFLDTSGQPAGQTIRPHSKTIWRLAFSPDGKVLASGSADKTVVFTDAATGQTIGQPITVFNDDIPGLAFSPDGRILATGSFDDSIYLWNASTHTLVGAPLNRPRSDAKTASYQIFQANDRVAAWMTFLGPLLVILAVYLVLRLTRKKRGSPQA